MGTKSGHKVINVVRRFGMVKLGLEMKPGGRVVCPLKDRKSPNGKQVVVLDLKIMIREFKENQQGPRARLRNFNFHCLYY